MGDRHISVGIYHKGWKRHGYYISIGACDERFFVGTLAEAMAEALRVFHYRPENVRWLEY